jgi:hypothetical protein
VSSASGELCGQNAKRVSRILPGILGGSSYRQSWLRSIGQLRRNSSTSFLGMENSRIKPHEPASGVCVTHSVSTSLKDCKSRSQVNEFEIQGLELDWIGLCWGGDFVWNQSSGWELRTIRHGWQTRWRLIKSAEKQSFRKNAYRVLLTRARQVMVLFIPKGDLDDSTNSPEQFEATSDYLIRCGVIPLEKTRHHVQKQEVVASLF